jgi:hypothetical protein
MAVISSPGRIPAVAAGEAASTAPTMGRSKRLASTAKPIM